MAKSFIIAKLKSGFNGIAFVTENRLKTRNFKKMIHTRVGYNSGYSARAKDKEGLDFFL